MPLHSVKAARLWRAENLDPAQSREFRMDAHPRPQSATRQAAALAVKPAPHGRPHGAEALALLDALAAAHRGAGITSAELPLVERLTALAEGDAEILPAAQAALRAVPAALRSRVRLPLELVRRLAAPLLSAADDGEAAPPAEIGDAEADEVGALLYQLAAGELVAD